MLSRTEGRIPPHIHTLKYPYKQEEESFGGVGSCGGWQGHN